MRLLPPLGFTLFGMCCAFSSLGVAGGRTVVEYQEQLTEIIVKNVVPELAKSPQKLDKGTVTLTVQVDLSGSVRRLEVVSSSANQFVEQVCARVIRLIKFPRVPKSVVTETGRDFVAMQTEIKIGE